MALVMLSVVEQRLDAVRGRPGGGTVTEVAATVEVLVAGDAAQASAAGVVAGQINWRKDVAHQVSLDTLVLRSL